MNEATDRNDGDYVGTAPSELHSGTLGAGAGSVGVVEHEHASAGDGADQSETSPTGTKVPDRLDASCEYGRQRELGHRLQRRFDEADERVHTSPRGPWC